jgi:hypothetical protein
MAAQFEYEVTIASGDSPGPWITLDFHEFHGSLGQVNGKSSLVLITLTPVNPGDTGYIETTTESLDKVYNDPGNLHPVVWTHGTVAIQTQTMVWAPTAFRAVAASGSIHVSARGI